MAGEGAVGEVGQGGGESGEAAEDGHGGEVEVGAFALPLIEDQVNLVGHGGGANRTVLLADSDVTDGAVSANRAVLEAGANGPPPHFHRRSAEIFFVLGGALRALAGDRVVTLGVGNFLAVPRNMPHASRRCRMWERMC